LSNLKELTSNKQIKKIFEYQNAIDFYLGVVYGKISVQLVDVFEEFHGRKVTDGERAELEKIYQLVMPEVKAILKQKTDKNPDF